MATNNITAPVRPANTEVGASPACTTRRAILGGAILAPAIIACATSAVAALPAGLRTEWDKVVAAFRAAHKAEQELFVIHGECEGRWLARAAEIDKDKPQKPESGPIVTSMTLDEIHAQGQAPEWKARWAAYEAAKAAWQAHRDAEEAAIMVEIEGKTEQAQDDSFETFVRVRDYPVTSLAMLAEKAALMHERYDGNLEGSEALALMADIQRLAAREA